MAGAPGARAGLLGAIWPRAGSEEVLEDPELVVEVELGVSPFPEAHAMTLADLVLLARDGGEGGAVPVLEEAQHIPVLDEAQTGEGS